MSFLLLIFLRCHNHNKITQNILIEYGPESTIMYQSRGIRLIQFSIMNIQQGDSEKNILLYTPHNLHLVRCKEYVVGYGSPTSNKRQKLLRELRFELCENTFHAYAFYNPPGNNAHIFGDSVNANLGRKLAPGEQNMVKTNSMKQ